MTKRFNKNNPNIYKTLTFIIIAIGILLRFALASAYSVSGDACWQLSASRFLAENKKFPLHENLGRDEPFWAPPLFHIMAASLYSAFKPLGLNAAEFAMKMLSPLFGALTLIFAYLISKRLFDERVAFYSMLFTTFIPISIDYHVFSYIDGAVAFFVVLSVYLALDGKYIKSSISAGLAALTKYNGIFILPLLLYIAYSAAKGKKGKALPAKRLAKLAVIILLPIIIASPWLVRNYIDFGNPFWPFANFLFHGYATSAFESAELQSFKIGNIFSINSITFTYLAVFGVPDGNYKNLFFFSIPYLKILIALWLLATVIFILPFAKCFSSNDRGKRKFLLIWICSYTAVLLLYIGNSSWTATRFFLPAIPALGMLYGIGLSSCDTAIKKIPQKSRLLSKIFARFFYIIIFLIVVGFVLTESAKISLASKEWGKYNEDFKWIRDNTKNEDLIIPGAQCLAYYLDRGTLSPKSENLKMADYVWISQSFRLERRSIATSEILKVVQENNYQKVYENKKTGTKIYKAKHK